MLLFFKSEMNLRVWRRVVGQKNLEVGMLGAISVDKIYSREMQVKLLSFDFRIWCLS